MLPKVNKLNEKREIKRSTIFKRKRLVWVGHWIRLDKQMPMWLALYESLQQAYVEEEMPEKTLVGPKGAY